MNSVPSGLVDFNTQEDFTAQDKSQPTSGLNIEGRVLSLKDGKELTAKRGFLVETLQQLRLFSVTEQDLPALGVTVPFEKLPSTIAIPFLSEKSGVLTLTRIHKTSAQGIEYPPYITPLPIGSNDIVIAESEIKAAMIHQLGDQGIGMQGAGSFLGRVALLANSVRMRTNQGARLFVLPDHERLIINGKHTVYEPTIQMIRLAYALSLDLGCQVKIITLPDRFFKPTQTRNGEPKVKADLDGCVADGMSQEEWRQLKEVATAPWELHIPVQFIVEGMAAADIDEFLKTTMLKTRLGGLSVDEAFAVCRALAGVLRKKSVHPDGKFDKPKNEMFKKSAAEWAKKNGLKNVNTKTFLTAMPGDKLESSDENLIAHCMRETERGVVLVKNGDDAEVVAPFVLQSCIYGEVYYPGSATHRRYQATIKMCLGGKPQTQVITLENDLFNGEQYTTALADLVVSDSRRFKMYVGEKLQTVDFQRHDPTLDSPLFVGIAKNGDQSFPLGKTRFPRGDQDCYYHGAQLRDSGDANVSFQEIAAISPPMDVAFAHLLGAPLKAFFGAYPHGSWVGDASAAKSTIAAEICARTGLGLVAAQEQLTSRYRQLRIIGNHNVPVFVDESHRLPPEYASGALAVLNTAYNGTYCTHGPDGHYFVAGCAILLGQDKAFDDEAFDSKQIIVHFDPEKLNTNALKKAKAQRTGFPYTQWLEFLATAGHKVQDILNLKIEFLNQMLNSDGGIRAGMERTIFNYAAVLVSAELLREFAVNIDIESKLVAFCRLHLCGKLHDQDSHPTASSCAERFIRDALDAVTANRDAQHLAGNFDIHAEKGVWLRLSPVFAHLKKQNPARYDVRDPARMGECIHKRFNKHGVTSGNKHDFGHARKDALFIPAALCEQLGIELLEPENDSGIS